MFYFRVYGLTICVDKPLPYAIPIAEACCPDITVFFTSDSSADVSTGNTWYPITIPTQSGFPPYIFESESWYRFNYQRGDTVDLVFFIAKDVKSVHVWRQPEIPIEDAYALFLGTVLSNILILKHRISLHGCVLSYGDQAFALLGDKGVGKSTTTLALLRAGAKLIADDVVVLNYKQNVIEVSHGYSAIRLNADVVKQEFHTDAAFQKVLSVGEKRYVEVTCPEVKSSLDTRCLPLVTLYVLSSLDDKTSTTYHELLLPSEAHRALLPHNRATQFLGTQQRQEYFMELAKLVKNLPVKRLIRPKDLTSLPNIASEILNDLEPKKRKAG